jgi:RND superfamily putative drug exporter
VRLAAARRGKFLVLLAWLLLAGLLSTQAARLPRLYDQGAATRLPAGSESQRALDLERRAFPDAAGTPAVVVLHDAGGLGLDDRRLARSISGWLASPARPAGVLGILSVYEVPAAGAQLISADGTTMTMLVRVDAGRVQPVVGVLRDRLHELTGGTAVDAHVTGPAGIAADAVAAFGSVDVRLLLTTIGLVLVLLVVLYRSPILPLVPLIGVGVAMQVANGLLALAAARGLFPVGQMSANIATVLMFGAGTDYGIFLAARYREELRTTSDRHLAMRAALRAIAEAIASSGAAVLLALLTLLLATLGLYASLGPVLAVAMVVILAAGLTLFPALLALLGRWAYWPFVPRPAASPSRTGAWGRVGTAVARHPLPAVVAGTMLLVLLALGNLRTTESYGFLDAFRVPTDSAAGFAALREHFEPGDLAPTTVVVRGASAADVGAAAVAAGGVHGVATVRGPGRGDVSADGRTRRFGVVFSDDPYGQPAIGRVAAVRAAVADELRRRGAVAEVHLGGETSNLADVRDLSTRDRLVIVPAVLLVVGVVLALLLRGLVAPLYLLVAVTLNWAAALGLGGLLFGRDGVNYAIPLYTFVFLVSLGADYTIFLMSRIREELGRRPTRQAVAEAVGRTGGVISSAGLILAGTFAVLTTLPLTVLYELGSCVAAGILLDTFVVRTLVVPGLVTLSAGAGRRGPRRGRPSRSDPGTA